MALQISANLGHLWQDLALPDAVRAAASAGFDAVEFHAPFSTDVDELSEAISETGLPVISLNTRFSASTGDYGLAAVPGREADARARIDEAVQYAAAIGARNVSVLAGCAPRSTESDTTYVSNIGYASKQARREAVGILIEPINTTSFPGYYLSRLDHGLEVIENVGAENVSLMVDCFHTSIMEGDVFSAIEPHLEHVGHIQISSVPDRAEPDHGDLDYAELLKAIAETGGYNGVYGAEYNPLETVEAGLAWLDAWHRWEGLT
ncbi:MAG: hydroxypyruvate isomerase [Verrucomicrobiales bacterium]|jgi:hydroxypyruvate isomerase